MTVLEMKDKLELELVAGEAGLRKKLQMVL